MIDIRVEGRCGRVTLNRPEAMNALNAAMVTALASALRDWQEAAGVDLVVIDAAGSQAFCAGGDIAEIHAQGMAGNFAQAQAFWRDEYRMNLMIARYPKPVVSLMHGFTMGGGVGIGCHASHRIVGESSKIAMPECGIGLVPDVGGSALLARAPGHLGAYLGLTGARMGPGDAIYAGFADDFVPEARWPALTKALTQRGITALAGFMAPAPKADLPGLQAQIDRHFAAPSLSAVWRGLGADDSSFAQNTLKTLARVSPLAASATLEIQRRLGRNPDLETALALEFRYTYRAQEQGDFLEGIRARIIDKDHKPRWLHQGPEAVEAGAVEAMLAPLGAAEWQAEDGI